MSNRLAQLPRDPDAPSPGPEQRMIANSIAALAAAEFDALCEPGADMAFDLLMGLLDLVDDDLRGLSDNITLQYFSHAEPRVS
jgi:hypothetical protein